MNLHSLLTNQLFNGGLLLMVTGAMMGLLRQVPGKVYTWIKHQLFVSVMITDRDPLFEWAKLWLDSLPYAKKARNISCALYRETDEEFSAHSKILFEPGLGNHCFRYKSRWVWLERDKPKQDGNAAAVSGKGQALETITLTVMGTKQATVRSLVKEIVDFADQDERRRTRAYISSCSWWRRLPTFSPRQLETVDLPKQDEVKILVAIEEFLKSRALYNQRGIPYHLNFLFAGLPGTGKTSLASALCGYFGLNLHLLNIAGPGMNDERLVELMLSLPRRSMILMEDVDALVPERKTKPKQVTANQDTAAPSGAAKEENQGVTLSGLLNCMDGLTAPDGAVIVMTTNHPELIDPALLRPGRVDVRVNFGPATMEQIERMCLRLRPNQKLNGEVKMMLGKNLTTAEVQAELLRPIL